MEDIIKERLESLYKKKDRLDSYSNGDRVYVQETNGLSLYEKGLINNSKIEILEEILNSKRKSTPSPFSGFLGNALG
jgi:hypothetical protein